MLSLFRICRLPLALFFACETWASLAAGRLTVALFCLVVCVVLLPRKWRNRLGRLLGRSGRNLDQLARTLAANARNERVPVTVAVASAAAEPAPEPRRFWLPGDPRLPGEPR